MGIANRDAHLTEKGWTQAQALGAHMLRYDATRAVQLVVVSPLMRALETAAGVFGDALPSNSAACTLLMVGQGEAPRERTAHPALAARPKLRYLANELCRERMGPSPCDARRPRSQACAAFPGVDFSLIADDADPSWVAGAAEEEAAVATRGRQFLQFLMSLPEDNVAVVTHSAFLWFTLALFGGDYSKPVRDRLQRWYENCEMRTVVLGDAGGAGVVDATHFRGGHAAAEPQQALMEADTAMEAAG